MEVYWKLASIDASARETASTCLIKDLQQAQSQMQPQPQVKDTKKKANDKGISSDTEEVLLGASAEDDEFSNCAPAVQYALKRLVRGVGSSRESARQGFATALALVLESFSCVKLQSVLKLIQKTLEVTSSMKGQEKRDGLLGQLFALGALVRADRIASDSTDAELLNLVKDITEHLLSLANKKAFLREPAITLLLHFTEKLSPSVLKGGVFSSSTFQEILSMGIESQNADVLLLALRLREQLPESISEACPLLPSSASTHAIFESSHLATLVHVLKESTTCHPRVHPVWQILIELLFVDSSNLKLETPSKKKKKRQKVELNDGIESFDQRLRCFWNSVVDSSLLPSSHERKYLAMELLQLILSRLPTQYADIVLSDVLIHCLIDNLAAKGTLLHNSAEKCVKYLCEWGKADEQRAIALIIPLQYCSHGKFDSLTKTDTVKQLLSALKSKEAFFSLYYKLIEYFCKMTNIASQSKVLSNDNHEDIAVENESKKPRMEKVTAAESYRFWVLDQVYSLVKQAKVVPEVQFSLQKELLKFLSANGLFQGSVGVKCTVQGTEEDIRFSEVPLSEDTRKICLSRLQSLLIDVSVAPRLPKDQKVDNTFHSLDLRFFFLELYEKLEKIEGVTQTKTISETDKDAINALRSCMVQLSEAATKVEHEKAKKLEAMSTLIMQLLFRALTSEVVDVAADLIMCCKRAFGDLVEVAMEGENGLDDDGEQPEFMDVLVDILLSLLAESQSSAPIRAATEQVFRCFSGDLTEASLLSLLRVIKKQLGGSRRRAAVDIDDDDNNDDDIVEVEDSDDNESDDDDDDADDSEDENDKSEKDEDEDEDDDDNDNDNDEEESEKQDKLNSSSKQSSQLKQSSKTPDALEHDSDSDSEDSGSDMDDETMFRMDKHLANILKQRASAGDEREDGQVQLQHFKFRVLSLLEHFLHREGQSPLCLIAVQHLFQSFILTSSVGTNFSAQLSDKIVSVLRNNLFKSKKYPKGEDVDLDAVERLLKKCLKVASRSKAKKVRDIAESCSLWLLKILYAQAQPEGNVNESVKGIIKDAIDDFFCHHKSCYKVVFFRDLFNRFPVFGISNFGYLLEKCGESRTECLKYEAVSLVTSILQLKHGNDDNVFKQCLSEHTKDLSRILVSLIENPSNKQSRKKHTRQYCLALLRVISREFPGKPVKNLIGKSAYEHCLKCLGSPLLESVLKSQAVANAKENKEKSQTPMKKKSQAVTNANGILQTPSGKKSQAVTNANANKEKTQTPKKKTRAVTTANENKEKAQTPSNVNEKNEKSQTSPKKKTKRNSDQ